MTVIVLDLEAVTEPWWSPPPGKPDAFAPAPAWRIVCAGLLVSGTGEPAITTLTGDERTILVALRDYLDDAAQIVTWHGRRYDVPVIMARSLAHGIEQGWYYGGRSGAGQDPRYRYAGTGARHLDLADQLADYGAGSAGSLDDLAHALGLDGKGDTKGSDVAGMYARGEIDAIARYCARDVLVTALVWARWELLAGAAGDVRTLAREAWIRAALADNAERQS